MFTITKSVEINRPVEEVFAYIMNTDNDKYWQTGVIEVRVDRPMGLGARLTSVRKFLGLRIEGVTEVIEYQPNAKRVTRGVGGPFAVTATQTYEKVANGMRLTFHAEAELSGIFRIVEGIIGRETEKMLEGFLINLKRNLEAS